MVHTYIYTTQVALPSPLSFPDLANFLEIHIQKPFKEKARDLSKCKKHITNLSLYSPYSFITFTQEASFSTYLFVHTGLFNFLNIKDNKTETLFFFWLIKLKLCFNGVSVFSCLIFCFSFCLLPLSTIFVCFFHQPHKQKEPHL